MVLAMFVVEWGKIVIIYTVWFARTNVIGSGTLFIIGSVCSSVH